MKTIHLLAGTLFSELEYARMLELELIGRGYRVLRQEGGDCAAILLVFDRISSAEAEALAGSANNRGVPVLCCACERTDPLPSGMIFLERPFDLLRFCDFVSVITDKGKSEAQRRRGLTDDIAIDRERKLVTCRGEKIGLTAREYELLLYLDDHRGAPVTREEAIRDVWEFGYAGNTNVVDVYIRYLRKKLDERFDARFIVTVRGRGYMLR